MKLIKLHDGPYIPLNSIIQINPPIFNKKAERWSYMVLYKGLNSYREHTTYMAKLVDDETKALRQLSSFVERFNELSG